MTVLEFEEAVLRRFSSAFGPRPKQSSETSTSNDKPVGICL